MIRDPHEVRVLCMKMYRALRELGDTPEKARSVLAPIYAQLEREWPGR